MNQKADTPTADLLSPRRLDELEQCIQSRLHGRVRDLKVWIRGDGLVLEGHTHTYHAKQLAQHAVMQAVAVPIRVNAIDVS